MTIIVRVNNLKFSLIGPHYSTLISSREIKFWCLFVYASKVEMARAKDG